MPRSRTTEERLHVLVVESHTKDKGGICRILTSSKSPGFEVRCTAEQTEALQALVAESFDMALIDDTLGEKITLGLLDLAKARGIDVPIVVVAAKPTRTADLRVMRAGAAYYLARSFLDGTTLERAVRYSGQLRVTRGALRESEAHTRAVLDSAVDGIVTIDEDGTIKTFNPAASRIFGYQTEEVIGKNVNLLMPPPFRDEHDIYIRRYRSTGEPRIIGIGREVVGLRKDGSTFALDLSISEIRYRRERRFLGIVRDLTESKQAEADLRDARALAQQRERLADIGAITARIVHDIGNPVAGIAMQAQLLLHRLDKDPAIPGASLRKSIERIQAATRHLDCLVKEFLDFSREQRLDLHSVSLPELIEEVVTVWQPLAANRNVTVSRAIQGNMPPLLLDEEKIRRVFDNLIKNAVEAIGQGPGSVAVRAMLTGTDRIRITIEDTGPGIAPGVEPFRLFETTKENGTGLGLAIVHQFVQAHGGTIGFAARKPHGTVFNVELPQRS